MNELAIPAMRPAAIARVAALEAHSALRPQVEIATHHVLHGGVYARTILMPAGTLLTGALVDIATTLIVSGDCTVAVGDGAAERLAGYHVLAASARRKQAFLAHADTHLTMMFATAAESVEEAEDEFTAEAHKLMSRQPGHANTIVITGQ
jgi:hypothetical protein